MADNRDPILEKGEEPPPSPNTIERLRRTLFQIDGISHSTPMHDQPGTSSIPNIPVTNPSINQLSTINDQPPITAPVLSATNPFAQQTDEDDFEINPNNYNNNISSPQVTNVVLNHLLEQITQHFQQLSETRPDPIVGAVTRSGTNTNPEPMDTSTPNGNAIVNQPRQQNPKVELTLDKIQLPVFNGDLTNWIAFRDQYLDLVHNNNNLTAVTKFYQLKSHLSGLALEAINGFKLSAIDYESAWMMLCNRYDRRDKIIDEYFKHFCDLPNLTNVKEPTAIQLINMVNKTNQLIRALPNFDINVGTWDSMLMYQLKSKLDLNTFKKWLNQAKRRQNIPLSEFLEFIENEASERIGMVSPTNVQTSINTSKKPKQKPKLNCTTMMTSSNVTYPPCQDCKSTQHAIFKCPSFKVKDVQARLKIVANTPLCRVCLRIHGENQCTFDPCPHCAKNHNSLLCFKQEKEFKKKIKANQANASANDQAKPSVSNEKTDDEQ